MTYRANKNFSIDVGFNVTVLEVKNAVIQTNSILTDLPSTLFKSIDYKTTSAMIGAVFCDTLANLIDGAIVNPIEKGHPDIIPVNGANSSEEELRRYPLGLEVKCTIGNIEKGANLKAGEMRISKLTGITWQAHHREVEQLLGLIWDFVDCGHSFNYPMITGAFYSDSLITDDWGEISGTTGRNTKVTGMRVNGKEKMGNGWIVLIDKPEFLEKFKKFLNFNI